MTPKVSVIMPAYNADRTIAQSVDSVLKQSFRDFELIIVDDGSTDATQQVLAQFNDPRIRIETIKHAGRSAARNRAVALSKSGLLAFIDADDLWLEDKLQAQVSALESSALSSAVYGWTDYIDDSGKYIFPGCHISVQGGVYADILVNAFLESGSNILVKKEAFEASGGFDSALEPSEDWAWSVRLARQANFICVKRVLVLYRISAFAGSADFIKFRDSTLAVIRYNFSQAPESLRHLEKSALRNMRQHLLLRRIELFLLHHPRWKFIRGLWHGLLRCSCLRLIIRSAMNCLTAASIRGRK